MDINKLVYIILNESNINDKPGGSNVGKYSSSDGPFCGPSGGSPGGSFPIGTKKRAIAALAYSRNAPNPSGIKSCVHKHYPNLGKE